MHRFMNSIVRRPGRFAVMPLLAWATASFGQDCPTWTERTSGGPPARDVMGIAFDTARARTVLFGGYGSTINDDTWVWDGVTWTLAATTGPEARFLNALAYDSQRSRVVLFGGQGTSTGYKRDTWEWDGSTWLSRSNTGPAARHGHALAYDTVRGRTILFGGYAPSSGFLGDTWEWNGTAWSQVATTGPSPRDRHAMAYDESREVTVLFGGDGGSFDTWEWNGTTWTQKLVTPPTTVPYSKMAYDAHRQHTVLFAGPTSPGGSGSTWEWNGLAWAPLTAIGPTWRDNPGLAFDRQRQRLVLFGGGAGGAHNDTWELAECCSASGYALSFDGLNDHVRVPDSASLDLSSAATIEFWFAPQATATDYQALIQKGDGLTATSDRAYEIRLNGIGHPSGPGYDCTFFVGTNTYATAFVPASWTPGVWTHLAATFDQAAGEIRAYVNGSLAGVTSTTAGGQPITMAIRNSSQPLLLGVVPSFGGFYKGSLDELRVWNIARSPEQIAADYDHRIVPNSSGLVGYWNFDECCNAQYANDATPFANQGSLGATPSASSDDPVQISSTVSLVPTPWMTNLFEFGGHRYRLTGPMSWMDAEVQAQSIGGHLATIGSSLENSWVQSTFSPLAGNPQLGVWIGMFQPPGSSEPGGGWVWASDEPVTYTNWQVGEPNNYATRGNENTVNMNGGVWNDAAGDAYCLAGVVEITDCNTNGTGDELDLQIGTGFDCNTNDTLDACDVDCNTNATSDACDAAVEDCNSNGTVDACEPGFADCNSNETLDLCDAALSGLDCTTNQTVDSCELQLNGGSPYVGSRQGDTVYQLDTATGEVVGPVALMPIDDVSGVAFSAGGTLVVASRGLNRVLELDPDSGALIRILIMSGSGGLSLPSGLVYGPNGMLYVSSFGNNKINEYDAATGAFQRSLTAAGVSGPTGLCIDLLGRLVVCFETSDRIVALDLGSGLVVDVFDAPPALDAPQDCTMGPDGWLYVSCAQTDSILRFDVATGAYSTTLASIAGLDGPHGLAIGPNGHLFAVSRLSNAVYEYDLATGMPIDRQPSTPGVVDPYASSALLRRPTFLAFREGLSDCDGNGVPDLCELATRDANSNGALDACELIGDLDGDGVIGTGDIFAFVDVLLRIDLNPSHIVRADLNGDDLADGDDIEPFIAAMTP